MVEEKSIFVSELKVSYKVAGEETVLLILHGWGSSSDRWQPVQAILAQEGYKVIVPDLPGFGKSQPPATAWGAEEYVEFVKTFMDNLGMQQFFLAGHSFGGQVAFLFAARYAERVQKLILIAPAVVRHEPRVKEKVLAVLAKLLHLIPSERARDFVRKVLYALVGKTDYAKTAGIMRNVMAKVIREDLSSLFSRVQTPTLLLWGDKDNVTPTKDAFVMQKSMPHVRLEIFDGVGHRLRAQAPEKLAASITKFLRPRK